MIASEQTRYTFLIIIMSSSQDVDHDALSEYSCSILTKRHKYRKNVSSCDFI